MINQIRFAIIELYISEEEPTYDLFLIHASVRQSIRNGIKNVIAEVRCTGVCRTFITNFTTFLIE